MEEINFYIFVIYVGAAILATVALYARQVLPVVYIILGAVIGPGGIDFLPDLEFIEKLSHIGIFFLLFLLGLDLYPQKLIKLFQSVTWITVIASTLFFALGYGVAISFGFTQIEAVVTGIASGFSSTIIGIKLLPTTALHHKHIGELVIGLLLMQDLLAIIALVAISQMGGSAEFTLRTLLPVIGLPVFVCIAFLLENYVIRKIIAKFETIHEYIFLVAIAWCLGMGQLGSVFGLVHEVGAFVAGVAMAASPIARYLAEHLRPLRDFFLVLFFVAVGAYFKPDAFASVFLPAIVLTLLVLAIKPITYKTLLVYFREKAETGWETGIRLGQLSEFSILLVLLAIESGIIGNDAVNFLLIATVLTLIGSSYLIVFRYPTPVAVSAKLRRD